MSAHATPPRLDASSSRTPVVLHVIESFGAGSAAAMQEFVDATPECTHHLLRAVREGEFVDSDTSGRFSRVLELPQGTVARIRSIRATAAALSPDVVHAHSSFGGLYVRLALRTSRRTRIVYSPHCFAFERRDLPLPARALIAAAELALAANTDVIAACSHRERHIAARFPTRRRPVYVPNTPRAAAGDSRAARTDLAPTVVSIGRLGSQKDPARFAAVIASAQRTLPGLRAVWIGDGDPALRSTLEEAGVRVTGWVSTADVTRTLADADVYVHTAAWEGFPLAVLEAITVGVPVVARRIGAFAGMPDEWLFDDDDQAARSIDAAHRARERNLSAWRHALRENTPAQQREALLRVYRAPDVGAAEAPSTAGPRR